MHKNNIHSILAFALLLLVASIGSSCDQSTPKPDGQLTDTDSMRKSSTNLEQLAFDYAIAYHYNGEDGGYILEDGELHPDIYKEQRLNVEQSEYFFKLITAADTYGGTPQRCFIPHLGVVFYLDDGTTVGQVSICFQCNQQASTPNIKVQDDAEFMGYSPAGENKMIEFCKSLNFGHCGVMDEMPMDD